MSKFSGAKFEKSSFQLEVEGDLDNLLGGF
jgi:hypothetical protein